MTLTLNLKRMRMGVWHNKLRQNVGKPNQQFE